MSGCIFICILGIEIVKNEAKAQTTGFGKHRQGICPDGWHLPTNSRQNSPILLICIE
jgi:hypothetical protein